MGRVVGNGGVESGVGADFEIEGAGGTVEGTVERVGNGHTQRCGGVESGKECDAKLEWYGGDAGRQGVPRTERTVQSVQFMNSFVLRSSKRSARAESSNGWSEITTKCAWGNHCREEDIIRTVRTHRGRFAGTIITLMNKGMLEVKSLLGHNLLMGSLCHVVHEMVTKSRKMLQQHILTQ